MLGAGEGASAPTPRPGGISHRPGPGNYLETSWRYNTPPPTHTHNRPKMVHPESASAFGTHWECHCSPEESVLM